MTGYIPLAQKLDSNLKQYEALQNKVFRGGWNGLSSPYEQELRRKFREFSDILKGKKTLEGKKTRYWASRSGRQGRIELANEKWDEILRYSEGTDRPLQDFMRNNPIAQEFARDNATALEGYRYLQRKMDREPDTKLKEKYNGLIKKLEDAYKTVDNKVEDVSQELSPEDDIKEVSGYAPTAASLNQGIVNQPSIRRTVGLGVGVTLITLATLLTPGLEKKVLSLFNSKKGTKAGIEYTQKHVPMPSVDGILGKAYAAQQIKKEATGNGGGDAGPDPTDLEAQIDYAGRMKNARINPFKVTNLDTGEIFDAKIGDNPLQCGKYKATLGEPATGVPEELVINGKRYPIKEVLEIPHDGIPPAKEVYFEVKPGEVVGIWHQLREKTTGWRQAHIRCNNKKEIWQSYKSYFTCEVPPVVTPPPKVTPPPEEKPPKEAPPVVTPPPRVTPPTEEAPPLPKCVLDARERGPWYDKVVRFFNVSEHSLEKWRKRIGEYKNPGQLIKNMFSDKDDFYKDGLTEMLQSGVTDSRWESFKHPKKKLYGPISLVEFEKMQNASGEDLDAILGAIDPAGKKSLLKLEEVRKAGDKSAYYELLFSSPKDRPKDDWENAHAVLKMTSENRAYHQILNSFAGWDVDDQRFEPIEKKNGRKGAAIVFEEYEWNSLTKSQKIRKIRKRLRPEHGLGFIVIEDTMQGDLVREPPKVYIMIPGYCPRGHFGFGWESPEEIAGDGKAAPEAAGEGPCHGSSGPGGNPC